MLKKLIYAVVIGAVITAATGLIDMTPAGLVGARWFGVPLAYRYLLVTFPPATNWDFTNLAIDFVIWIVAVFIVLWLLGRIWK